MSWISRLSPIVLSQSSELPYIVMEDGIRLCFHNYYGEEPSHSDHHIVFRTSKYELARKSATYYKFKIFPKIVPFSSIITLDNIIVDGKIVKHYPKNTDNETKNITVIKSRILPYLNEDEFQLLVERIDNSDHSFLLVGNEIDPHVRLLEDIVTVIHHKDNDWGRVCVTILDTLCNQKYRKYCWTKALPDTRITCLGLKNSDDMEQFQNTFDFIGVQNIEIIWED